MPPQGNVEFTYPASLIGFPEDRAVYPLAGRQAIGVGDTNGDGLSDMAAQFAGVAVVFGRANPGAEIDATELGRQGYRITAAPTSANVLLDESGPAAAIGDVNGDGLDDILVQGLLEPNYGAWVVFGRATAQDVELGALGPRGYRIDGSPDGSVNGDGLGDVNGDGLDDIALTVHAFEGRPSKIAVVFGSTAADPVNLAALGGRGYLIEGFGGETGQRIGVSPVGDYDGDGLADLVINRTDTRRGDPVDAFVAFGKPSTTAQQINALGKGGLHISSTGSGVVAVSAGDVNRDDRPDLWVRRGERQGVLFNGGQRGEYTLPPLEQLETGGLLLTGGHGPLRVIGDVNGDGQPDLQGRARGDNAVYYGDPRLARPEGTTTLGGFRVLGATPIDFPGDFDGSGAGDILLAGGTDNTRFAYLLLDKGPPLTAVAPGKPKLRVPRSLTVRVPVLCPANALGPCDGSLTVSRAHARGTAALAPRHFSAAPGQPAVVRVKLRGALARSMRRQWRAAIRARTVASDARGRSATLHRRLPLRLAGYRACGQTSEIAANPYGAFDIGSLRLPCPRARRVAARYARSLRVPGWRCDRRPRFPSRHKCSRGRAQVAFDIFTSA